MALSRVRVMGGQSAALQVSLPGYDVETTTLNNMAFDARFANMSVLLQVDVSFPEIRQTQATYDVPVYYGETLSRPPLAFVRIEETPASFGTVPPSLNNLNWVYFDGAEGTNGYTADVYTDHIMLHSLAYLPGRPSDNFWWPATMHLLLLRP